VPAEGYHFLQGERWALKPLAGRKMVDFDSFMRVLQANLADFTEWWGSINSTYRAGGCMLISLFLMWEATKASSMDQDRKFFVTGTAALCLLIYGAMLFMDGRAG
jgi:hypothetical protein